MNKRTSKQIVQELHYQKPMVSVEQEIVIGLIYYEIRGKKIAAIENCKCLSYLNLN